MINKKPMLIALNIKANEVSTSLGIDACYMGRDSTGKTYEPSPNTDYIRWDLIPNDIQRRSVKGNETDFMQNGIYQCTVFIGKSSGSNPVIKAPEIMDAVQLAFSQNLALEYDNQTCRINRCSYDVSLSNETHDYEVLSIYFDCLK